MRTENCWAALVAFAVAAFAVAALVGRSLAPMECDEPLPATTGPNGWAAGAEDMAEAGGKQQQVV